MVPELSGQRSKSVAVLSERVKDGWVASPELGERHLVTKGDTREHRGHRACRACEGAEMIWEEGEPGPVVIEGGTVGVQDIDERVCRERVEHDVDDVARA